MPIRPAHRDRNCLNACPEVCIGICDGLAPSVGEGDTDETRRCDGGSFGTDKRRERDGTAWLPDRRAFGAIGRREDARGTIAYAPQPSSLASSGPPLEQHEHVVPQAPGAPRGFRQPATRRLASKPTPHI